MKKTMKIVVLVAVLLMVFSTVVSAASAPYTTYTYSSTGFVLTSPDAYVPDTVVTAQTCGVGAFTDVRDIEVDHHGNDISQVSFVSSSV